MDKIVEIGLESGELAVSKTTPHHDPFCVAFNDSKKTTHEDVLRFLDLAIEMLPTTSAK